MRVVVVGGSGLVGSLVVPALAQEHDVSLADRVRADWWGGEFTQVDVLDHESLPALFDGADALVYMAMGPMAEWGSTSWARQHFDVSVTGAHLVMQAAGRAGVKRIVHTSSGSVFKDWDHKEPAEPADAVDAYGLSKSLGEGVARAAAQQFDIPVVALRLFYPRTRERHAELTGRDRGMSTAGPDVAAAYLAALGADVGPGFHVVHISGNRGGTIRIGAARELLGWEPRIP